MIRKKLSLLLSVLLVLSLLLSACGEDEEPKDDPKGTVTHTVTFDSQGGTAIPALTVVHGSPISEPTPPVRDSDLFEGWYYNGIKWTFDKTVNEDIKLVAKWSEASETFDYEVDSTTSEATILGLKRTVTETELVIPSTIKGFPVTAIGESAFEDGFAGVSMKIVLPATVKSVGDYAFAGCQNVRIDLSTNAVVLTHVGESAFADCNLLNGIILGEGMTELSAFAFMGCSSLSFVYLPSTLTYIDESVFERCGLLSTVLIPASVERIEDGAFHLCTSLSTLLYGGTGEEFDQLMSHTVKNSNDPLLALRESVILYSETEPTEEGSYWHYDDTHTPKIW